MKSARTGFVIAHHFRTECAWLKCRARKNEASSQSHTYVLLRTPPQPLTAGLLEWVGSGVHFLSSERITMGTDFWIKDGESTTGYQRALVVIQRWVRDYTAQ